MKFNGTAATATAWGATSITATVPTGATTGNVVVTVSNKASNGVSFSVVPVPSITSLSPTSGAVGAAVTVTGSNFGSTQGTGKVTFYNGVTATVTSWAAGSISVTAPSGGRIPEVLGSNTFGDIASMATGSGGLDHGAGVAADATAHAATSIASQVAVGTATSIGRAISSTGGVYNPVTVGTTTVTVGMTTAGKVILSAGKLEGASS